MKTGNEAHKARPDQLFTWQHCGLPDYAAVEAQLPVVENSVTQLSPGPFTVGATVVSNATVTLCRTEISSCATEFILLKPGYTGFVIPLRWTDDLSINGISAKSGVVYVPTAKGSMHIRGGQREQFSCTLPRSRFIETIAALRGVDADILATDDRPLTLAPEAASRLRRRCRAVLDRGLRAGSRSMLDRSFDFTEEIFELIVGAYLDAQPEPMTKSGRIRNPGRIVLAAEERFAQAGADPVSLADLCAAAGVSKSALYIAFASWCGEPPLSYFRRRRLTKARSELLRSAPARSKVKQVALGAGITAFGRFSVEYRQLFGETPSATLNTPAP